MSITRRTDEELAELPPGVRDLRWVFRCDNPECSESATAYRTKEQTIRLAEVHREFACPVKIKRRESVPSPYGRMWDKLDELTETVMSTPKDDRNSPEFLRAAGQATGLAFAIYTFMYNRFDSQESVSKFALHRRKVRLGKAAYDGTPGLHKSDDSLAKLEEESKIQAESGTEPESAEPQSRNTKDDSSSRAPDPDTAEAIKRGIKAGLPLAALSKAYKISESKIKEIAES